MTRKTGKAAIKARQLARSAKLAKYKKDLAEAGVSLSLPKPSPEALKEKEEEFKRLYRELFSGQQEGQGAEQQGSEELQEEQPGEGSEEGHEAEERQPSEEGQSE